VVAALRAARCWSSQRRWLVDDTASAASSYSPSVVGLAGVGHSPHRASYDGSVIAAGRQGESSMVDDSGSRPRSALDSPGHSEHAPCCGASCGCAAIGIPGSSDGAAGPCSHAGTGTGAGSATPCESAPSAPLSAPRRSGGTGVPPAPTGVRMPTRGACVTGGADCAGSSGAWSQANPAAAGGGCSQCWKCWRLVEGGAYGGSVVGVGSGHVTP